MYIYISAMIKQGPWAGVFLICRLFSLSANGRVFVILSHCTVLGVATKSPQDGHIVYIIITDLTNLCACFFFSPTLHLCVCACVRVCISSLGLGHFLGCCVYIHLVACLELLAGFPWSYWSVHATIVSLWEKLLPGGRIVSALLSLFLRLVFCFSHNA